jgi:hypothetical protein
MVEFIENNGLWVLLIAAMFLMHRLGIGCCGGHRHGREREPGEPRRSERKSTDPKVAPEREEETAAAARRDSCH